jgi:hypothetical protein
MKSIIVKLLPLLLLIISCDKKNKSDFGIDCDLFYSAVINSDQAFIESAVSKLTADLAPVPVQDDIIGHSANFEKLETRVHQCGISCQLICYCCVLPEDPINDPWISQIFISAVSGDKEILQVVDIITPRDGILIYKSSHHEK